ncbi:MAG: hypothetical protein ACI815_001435 [Psychroserpens sp.]|jgi:hypothetical protein
MARDILHHGIIANECGTFFKYSVLVSFYIRDKRNWPVTRYFKGLNFEKNKIVILILCLIQFA